jgi:hypothetical protein
MMQLWILIGVEFTTGFEYNHPGSIVGASITEPAWRIVFSAQVGVLLGIVLYVGMMWLQDYLVTRKNPAS